MLKITAALLLAGALVCALVVCATPFLGLLSLLRTVELMELHHL